MLLEDERNFMKQAKKKAFWKASSTMYTNFVLYLSRLEKILREIEAIENISGIAPN